MRASQNRLIIVVCLALGLAGGCDSSVQGVLGLDSASTTCVQPENIDTLSSQVIALVNQERVLRGMNALVHNERLTNSGGSYACKMVEEGFFGHDNPETGEGFVDRHFNGPFSCRTAGENLALGHTTAREVVEDWMNSSAHRENILTDAFLEIGVGVRKSSSDDRLYWVQMFVGDRMAGCEDEPAAEVNDFDGPSIFETGHLIVELSDTPDLPTGHEENPVTTSPQVTP